MSRTLALAGQTPGLVTEQRISLPAAGGLTVTGLQVVPPIGDPETPVARIVTIGPEIRTITPGPEPADGRHVSVGPEGRQVAADAETRVVSVPPTVRSVQISADYRSTEA